MGLIDFILNIAALLLWVNWRAVSFDPLTTATPATLVGTLRRAEPTRVRRWHFLLALGGLLFLRALGYRIVGPAIDWTASLDLLATRVAFRSNSLELMLLFSVLSFALALGLFLLGLLLLSMLGQGTGANALPVRLARAHLGLINEWANWKKLLLPWAVSFATWWLLTFPLAQWDLIPKPMSAMIRLSQAALVGLGAYFAWKYLIIALLILYLLHNYIYFGQHAFWNFVDAASRRLLGALDRLPLRMAKLDFAPVIGIILIVLFAHIAEYGVRSPIRKDINGRPEKPSFEIPGLIALYERLSR
jgi:hypothetical protein